eukprot:scaffold10099_cov149-Cylindrotheca_fusiformis.AAC.4
MTSANQSSLVQDLNLDDTESTTTSNDGTALSQVGRLESPVQTCSPPKRRRVSTVPFGWQSFCSKGNRFKRLLDDALVMASDVASFEEEKNKCSTTSSSKPSMYPSNVATMVRRKAAECIMLQQQLERVKSEHVQTVALNDELRDAAKQQAARLQKMTTALNLASQNAAKARTEADEAEAATMTLESQLEALQLVVQETKRASQVLLREHEEITQRTQTVEQKYVQAQADLVRSNAQRQKLQRANENLARDKQLLETQMHDLKTNMELQDMDSQRWQQTCSDLQHSEKMSQACIERLEGDLQHANNLLVEATAATAEKESTSIELRQSLVKMQQTVEALHKELETKNKNERDIKNHSQMMLAKAQKENQSLKAQFENEQEKTKKLTLEKKSREKRIGQLQAKSSNMERRLQESTIVVSTANTSDFQIPPLNDKENSQNLPSFKCSICFKALTTGLMKKCQCREKGCAERAHITCVNKITAAPSLSHPGTPPPPLPVILCSATKPKPVAITPHIKAVPPVPAMSSIP